MNNYNVSLIVYVMICRFLFWKCWHFVLCSYSHGVSLTICSHFLKFSHILRPRATAVTATWSMQPEKLWTKQTRRHRQREQKPLPLSSLAELTFVLRAQFFCRVGNWMELLFDGRRVRRHICINCAKLPPPTLQLIQIKMSHLKTCLRQRASLSHGLI